MKVFGDGNFGCGNLVNHQKAFDIVDHRILLRKLCHYGIRGLANKLFNYIQQIVSNLHQSMVLH